MTDVSSQPTPTETSLTPSPTPTPGGTDPAAVPATDQSLLGAKPAEPTAPEFVPYTAESIKLPEGVTIDESLRDGFIQFANERKLAPEVVNHLVELQVGAVRAASEKASTQWAETQQQWRSEVEKHATFGGEKLAPVLGKISEFIDAHSSNPAAFRQMMDITGAGNNVHVIELLSKAAEIVSEGKPVPTPSPSGSVGNDLAALLYPTMKRS